MYVYCLLCYYIQLQLPKELRLPILEQPSEIKAVFCKTLLSPILLPFKSNNALGKPETKESYY